MFLCGRLAEGDSTIEREPSSSRSRSSAAGVAAHAGGRDAASGTTSTFSAGTDRWRSRSARVLAASTMIRCERRAAAGTSTLIPRPRSPKWVSGTSL